MPIVPGSQVQLCNTTAVECVNADRLDPQGLGNELALHTLSNCRKTAKCYDN